MQMPCFLALCQVKLGLTRKESDFAQVKHGRSAVQENGSGSLYQKMLSRFRGYQSGQWRGGVALLPALWPMLEPAHSSLMIQNSSTHCFGSSCSTHEEEDKSSLIVAQRDTDC